MERYYDLGVYLTVEECPTDVPFITDVKQIPAGWKPIDVLPEFERLYPRTCTADYIGACGLHTHCDKIKFDSRVAFRKDANARCFEEIMECNELIACHAVFCKTYYVLEREEDDVVEPDFRFHYYAAVEEWYCNPGWIFPSNTSPTSRYRERHPEAVIFERSEFPYEVYWGYEDYKDRLGAEAARRIDEA
jgi:hypothetical protein